LRLDSYLSERFGISRTKAQRFIQEGVVCVEGVCITKNSHEVVEGSDVVLHVEKDYVSRAALKLLPFLQEAGISVAGKEALDIGSSTGGFTQVLLEMGAKHVTCVDVGSHQLHDSLRGDKRISLYEQTDIRNFESEPFELVVSDVSFISLLKILDTIDTLAKDEIVLLFKPQFEVGRGVKRDKKGVIKDEKAVQKAMIGFEDACTLKGWKLLCKAPSKITGKDGNLEYCYYFKKC